MLNQKQRDTFRLALASLNSYSAERVEDLDINSVISDARVVETADTVEDFFKANGRKLLKNGSRPVVPREQNTTLLGVVYTWDGVQARKGARRGTLYVMDFGTARAAFFDGEA